MKKKQLLVLGLLALGFTAWWFLAPGRYLELDVLQARIGELRDWRTAYPLQAGLLYFAAYVFVAALSIPGAAVLTLAGGALFGFWYALLLVSFGSSIGAALAFLVSRILLADWVQSRFARQLRAVNAGFERDGAWYLLSLRLVPLFPFVLVNLLAGLLPLPLWRFYWVSQLGMLPATAVYVNAGRELGGLRSVSGILSPDLLGAFVLLALFPLAAARLSAWLGARRALSGWRQPRRFDTNLVVVGAGSAGLVTALVAATVKAGVTLIERERMGGDCLNTGCVPSKALLRSAHLARLLRRAQEFGLATAPPEVNFSRVMRRVQEAVRTVAPHDSVERYTALGVDCLQGEARIVSPWEVEIDGRRIAARHIVIASGARPHVPAIPGIGEIDYLTSDTVWTLEALPARLLVIGGGPVGCELAQAFSRLGSAVTLVTRAAQILPREDLEIAARLETALREEGVEVLCRAQPLAFEPGAPDACRVSVDGEQRRLAFDRVLIAAGRDANVEGLWVGGLDIGLTAQGRVAVDDCLRTTIPTIYAAGDVAGPYLFTHMAGHQGWYAAVNALFGHLHRFRVDYSAVPWATFTDPEVARVGLNEREAQAAEIACEATCFDFADLDRAIADGEARGCVRVLTGPGSDRILGATVVGPRAGELIHEFTLAMRCGIGLNRLLGTIHVYPTYSEAGKLAAGQWRRAHQPRAALSLLERYHRFRRGR